LKKAVREEDVSLSETMWVTGCPRARKKASAARKPLTYAGAEREVMGSTWINPWSTVTSTYSAPERARIGNRPVRSAASHCDRGTQRA
jgi:hypothetical protein